MHSPLRRDARPLLLAAALAAGLCALPAQAQTGNFSGTWSASTFNAVHIQQSGANVIGTYDFKGGQLRGTVQNGVLTGIWAQNSAARSCADTRMGSHYWGKFTLQVINGGAGFSGVWGYCDADPTDAWNGHR